MKTDDVPRQARDNRKGKFTLKPHAVSADFYKVYRNLTATAMHGRPPKHVMVTAETYPREGPKR